MASNLSALDRLRKAANLEPIKKEVTLSDGSIFEMYVTPLTMAERERAQKQARSDDANAFALQLLLAKAQDQTASRSILADIILTSASFNVNPDDGQLVEIAFRPSAAPTFDLSKSA